MAIHKLALASGNSASVGLGKGWYDSTRERFLLDKIAKHCEQLISLYQRSSGEAGSVSAVKSGLPNPRTTVAHQGLPSSTTTPFRICVQV